jgi:hypothetical protein
MLERESLLSVLSAKPLHSLYPILTTLGPAIAALARFEDFAGGLRQ